MFYKVYFANHTECFDCKYEAFEASQKESDSEVWLISDTALIRIA